MQFTRVTPASRIWEESPAFLYSPKCLEGVFSEGRQVYRGL